MSESRGWAVFGDGPGDPGGGAARERALGCAIFYACLGQPPALGHVDAGRSLSLRSASAKQPRPCPSILPWVEGAAEWASRVTGLAVPWTGSALRPSAVPPGLPTPLPRGAALLPVSPAVSFLVSLFMLGWHVHQWFLDKVGLAGKYVSDLARLERPLLHAHARWALRPAMGVRVHEDSSLEVCRGCCIAFSRPVLLARTPEPRGAPALCRQSGSPLWERVASSRCLRRARTSEQRAGVGPCLFPVPGVSWPPQAGPTPGLACLVPAPSVFHPVPSWRLSLACRVLSVIVLPPRPPCFYPCLFFL